MGADVNVTVSLVQLERMQAQVQTRATAIIRKLAMDVEAEAKRTATRGCPESEAPVKRVGPTLPGPPARREPTEERRKPRLGACSA